MGLAHCSVVRLAHHYKMSALVNYLKSRIEILVLNLKTGLDPQSEPYQKLATAAVLAIKKMCTGVRTVSPQDLQQLLTIISDAPLTEEQRAELRDLFNQRIDETAGGSFTGVKVDFPEAYHRQVDWDTMLLKENIDVNTKLCFVANFWSNLGLTRPSEIASKNIASLAVLCEHESVLAGPMGVQHVRTFKKLFKEFSSIRTDGLSPLPPPKGFPSSVAEFGATEPIWYGKVYNQDGPVPCPTHVFALVKKIQSIMGCRSSKAGCSLQAFASRGASNMSPLAAQMLLQLQAHAISTSSQQAKQPPGFVIFDSPKPALPPPLAIADDSPAGSSGGSSQQGHSGGSSQPEALVIRETGDGESSSATAATARHEKGEGQQPLQVVQKRIKEMQEILARAPKKAKHMHVQEERQDEGEIDEGEEETEGQDIDEPRANPPKATSTAKKLKKAHKVLKRPAAPPKHSKVPEFAFPGTEPREPLVYGQSKVYFSRGRYRMLEHQKDRVDVAYSYKCTDPKEVWGRVVKRLMELNP